MSARANDTSEAAAKRSKKETVGIGFANLARTIADKWQSLDHADKAEYLEQAAKEKARYKSEMVVWRKKQKEEKERQASMPPQTVTGLLPAAQQNMTMMGGMGMLVGAAGHLYDDSRIHPALLQGASGLHQNNPYQQQQAANGLLFGSMHQPQQQSSSMMMQSYLQELSDNTLLQRQQQHLQELQARHQLLLSGSLDHQSMSTSSCPTPPPSAQTNTSASASYPDTWIELPTTQNQQQQQQQSTKNNTPSLQDGELRKLNPGNKNFGWQQAQLLQDQHLQQQLSGGGGEQMGGVDVGMLKDNMKSKQPPSLKQVPVMGANLHNLASKLDHDAISFLTEFRFNGNSSSSSSEGTA